MPERAAAVNPDRTRPDLTQQSRPRAAPFTMVFLSAKRRIKDAAREAREAGGRRYASQAIDLYLEVRDRADNLTGVAMIAPGVLEAALGVSRWSIWRATKILRAADAVTAEPTHDRRGYRCGMRYVVLKEPAAGSSVRLHYTDTKNAGVLAPVGPDLCCTDAENIGVLVASAADRGCTETAAYVAPVHQQKGTRSKSTKSIKSTAARAATHEERRTAKRPPDVATGGQVRALILDVRRLGGDTLTDVAELHAAVRRRLVAEGFFYDAKQLRAAIAAVLRPKSRIGPAQQRLPMVGRTVPGVAETTAYLAQLRGMAPQVDYGSPENMARRERQERDHAWLEEHTRQAAAELAVMAAPDREALRVTAAAELVTFRTTMPSEVYERALQATMCRLLVDRDRAAGPLAATG